MTTSTNSAQERMNRIEAQIDALNNAQTSGEVFNALNYLEDSLGEVLSGYENKLNRNYQVLKQKGQVLERREKKFQNGREEVQLVNRCSQLALCTLSASIGIAGAAVAIIWTEMNAR